MTGTRIAVETLPTKSVYTISRTESRLLDTAAAVEHLVQDADSATSIERLTEQFSSILGDYQNLEEHVAYHEHWQYAVLRYPIYFQQRNRLLPDAEALAALARSGSDPDREAVLRDRLLDAVSVFRPTPGLAMHDDGAGGLVLPVSVCTDIPDGAFLETTNRIVEDAFHQPLPGSSGEFRLEVSWRRIPLGELYPEQAPALGDPIDTADHLDRFDDCPLVLSTGAASTHAQVGRYVLLDSAPTTPGVLAHEFAHLLGFEDAYLRGYEGDPLSENGAELIEWWGLSDDLMGDSDHGAVSPRMLRTLVEAYGPDAGAP